MMKHSVRRMLGGATTAAREGNLKIFALILVVSAPVLAQMPSPCLAISPEAVKASDATMIIPMMGMVQSLNISVACAVTLYEALRQRRAAGYYERSRLSAGDIETRLNAWLQRERRVIPEISVDSAPDRQV